MGLFDDLIPNAPSSTGLFDDLLPKKGAAVADALKHDQDFEPTPEELSSGYKSRLSLPDPGAIWKGAKVLATETLPAQWNKSRQQVSEEGIPQFWNPSKFRGQAATAAATLGETALRGTAYLGDMLKTPLDAAIGEAAAEAQSPGNAMLRAAQMALGLTHGLTLPVSPRTPEQQRAAEQIWASRTKVAGIDERAMAPYHEGDKTFVPGALGAPAELASNFVDPTMAVPAAKAAGLLKMAGKGGEAASMAGRLSGAAKEAANTGGVAKKAAEVAAPALERGAQLAGEGLDKVATGLDKVQPVLDVGGLVKGGLPGAAGAHVVGRSVRAGVKWASKVRDASTGIRNIAKADWNSTWTIAQQLAKDSDAPVWLRRAASSSVAPLVESTVRGAGAVGEGALHGATIGGAASMVNDTLTPEERGEFIGGGAVLGGGGAALGKGIGAVTGRNAQARQAHDWAVMAHEAVQAGADPASVLGASDATMSYAHSLKQLFKGAMPGGKDLNVRLMDGNQFAEAHPNEPTAVGSFVTSPDGTHEVRLNLDRPEADSRALHEGLGHALLESVVGNTPDAFERARAVFSPDEINAAAQQYATALHPELKGPDQQTWIAQQQANSALRWGDRDAWILSELLSEGAVQAAGGRSIRDMASPGFGSSLMRAKPFKVDTASFFSGNVASKLNSPELTELVRGRVEQLGAFRPGIDEPKGNSVVIQKGDWGKKPFAPLHDLEKAPMQPPPLPRDPSQPPPLNPQPPTPAPQVPKGNDFVVVNPTTGAVVDRPPAQTRKLAKNRQKAVDAAVPRDVPPASPGDPDTQVKLRTSPSGLLERAGTTLGKWFYDGNVFSETTKQYARKIEEAIKSGSPLSGFYHEIGESARGWAKSVGERYGNLRAEYKDFIPVGFLVSTAGNLLVRNYSLTAFERKAQTWGARKGALSLELWNGDVGTFKADVQTYLKNHSEGRPGADDIGEQKRNVINAFLVGGNRSFEAVNPLRPLARGADREGIIRSYRLDRLETVEPSEITGFSQPKYEQQLRNLSPKSGQFSPQIIDGFRSKLNEVTDELQGSAMPKAQLLATLRNRGVKPEEMNWTGTDKLIERLASQNDGRVPINVLKAEVEKSVKTLQSQFEEVRGTDKPDRYELVDTHSGDLYEFSSRREAEEAMDARVNKYFEKSELFRVVENSDTGRFDVLDEWGDVLYSDLKSAEQAERAAKSHIYDFLVVTKAEKEDTVKYAEYALPGGSKYTETILRLDNFDDYVSGHFDGDDQGKGYVAHMRTTERTNADGPGLFIEELQSDRHQEGRRNGYRNEEALKEAEDKWTAAEEKYRQLNREYRDALKKDASDEEVASIKQRRDDVYNSEVLPAQKEVEKLNTGTPDAPYSKDWAVQMFKRALRDAVASGKKWVGWTTGKTQADRYQLSNHVDRIEWSSSNSQPGARLLSAFDRNNTRVYNSWVGSEDVAGVVGASLAEKINAEPNGTIQGANLDMGGEGMKAFYDRIAPNEIGKYVKKFGGKVEKAVVNGSTPIWSVKIGDEMAKTIRERGQELFSPRTPKDEREVILNLTSATGTLPGLDRLTREASGGDTKAEKTLNGITHDALQLLMSGVAGARVDIQDTRGVFGSSFEPAVQAVVRGTPESIDAALAAAERFAKNFNQQEIHRREVAPEGSYFGRTHDDGSFDTPVFAFTLKNELSPGDITRLIEASGLDAITQRGNTLEVYYAGDPTDQKRLLQFERSITALQNALGDGLQSYRTEAARLWRYGDGQNGTIPYERIRGDVRPEASQQNAIAKRIAERLRGKEVPGAPQAKEITPEQADLQTRIAKEFEAAPMNELDNPVVAKAYRELADELVTQYEHLPVKIEVLTGQGEPYKSSAEMRRDVAENNHLFIFGTTPDSFGPAGVDYKGHPLLEDSGFKDINGKPLLKNDLLRAVHDYYAHTMTPVEFGPKGEEAAWKNHMQMTKSPWARLALTTETRGQNSAVNFGKNAEHNRLNKKDTIFADQKVTVLDPEFSKIGDPEADAQIDAIANQVRNRSQAQFSPQVPLEPTPEYLERTPGARVYAAKLVDGAPHKYVNISVVKKDTSVAKNALEGAPEKRSEFYQRLDGATKEVAQDPVRLSHPKGYVEYMRDAGVSGDVMAPPAILKTLIETPQKYVDLVMGGYHGDKTKPGSLEAAISGLDSTLEMRKAIGEKPPALISALHHFWGILSRQATPLDQEGAWLRLISQPEVLDHIQKSIDGTFELTDTEWDGVVSRGMKASAQSSNRIGNAVTSNANSFYLMLNRWNGKWDRVSDIYAALNSIEMGRRFWAMGEGPVGIKNKVQRFVGLTFGTPGLIMDRWKFVEFYMGQFGKEPRDFFEYSATGTPGDPANLYAAYGGVESANPVLSLAFYEGMETALGKAIENSPELKQLLGRHANVGGLHWVGWNAIKNEAVGHSSLNMTYDLARKTSDPKPQDVLELLEKNEYFTEGLSGNTLRRFSLKDKK